MSEKFPWNCFLILESPIGQDGQQPIASLFNSVTFTVATFPNYAKFHKVMSLEVIRFKLNENGNAPITETKIMWFQNKPTQVTRTFFFYPWHTRAVISFQEGPSVCWSVPRALLHTLNSVSLRILSYFFSHGIFVNFRDGNLPGLLQLMFARILSLLPVGSARFSSTPCDADYTITIVVVGGGWKLQRARAWRSSTYINV